MCMCVWTHIYLTFIELSNDFSDSFSHIYPLKVLHLKKKKKSFLERKGKNVGVSDLFNVISILELVWCGFGVGFIFAALFFYFCFLVEHCH